MAFMMEISSKHGYHKSWQFPRLLVLMSNLSKSFLQENSNDKLQKLKTAEDNEYLLQKNLNVGNKKPCTGTNFSI